MFDIDTLLETAVTTIGTWTPKVLGAFAVMFGGWIFAGWTKRFAKKALKRSAVDDMLIPFMSGILHVAVIVMVAIAAIGVLGVNTAGFVAVLGAAGLAIALAFQDTFSNFAAGVLLLTFRPFKVGDWVELSGKAGTVREVGIFNCMLTTGDNVQIRIPNSQIFGNTIVNYSASETRRIDLVMGVGYDDDLEVVIKTIHEVLGAEERLLAEPEPVVAVHELADSSVNLVVRPWVSAADYWATRWALTRDLKEKLEAAGCNIPYPQRDIHLHQAS